MSNVSKTKQKPLKIKTVKNGGVSMPAKEDLICNQLTVLEIFLEKMVNREYINEEVRGKTQQVAFETLLKPMLKKIKQFGEKMERGLFIRKKIMELNTLSHSDTSLEEYYQAEKAKLQSAYEREFSEVKK